MKVPSRTTLLLLSVIGGLLLAGILLLQAESRRQQYSENDGLFEQKYRHTVTELCLAQDAVKDCFRNNGTRLKEVRNPAPAPVPAVVKESGIRQEQAAPAPAPIILQGISWAEERPVAMINGNVYLEGDLIDSFTVKEIRSRSILLRDAAGADVEIKLLEDAAP